MTGTHRARFAIAVGLFVSVACLPLWKGSPKPLAPDDWRRPLVGTWNVAFAVDSIEAPVCDTSGFHGLWTRRALAPTEWIIGSLEVVDTLVVTRDALMGRGDVDFNTVLGPPSSCFGSIGRRYVQPMFQDISMNVWVSRHNTVGTVQIAFTTSRQWRRIIRGGGDLHGDSIIGSWREFSPPEAVVFGRLLMIRRPVP
jgi:hypothetical protein